MTKENVCKHKSILEISEKMPCEEKLYDVADLFKVFGDCTRIKIIYGLFESELCVNHIAQLLNMTQSAISHQLKTLKDARLVTSRREGKEIYYALADKHIKNIFEQGYKHICEKE
ncbi:MAG: helix-turn-helix transcriptional regulator [Clostridia bacterium]|nr:helix-turn-helix transcriptional regulator [Clostridia bacterium]